VTGSLSTTALLTEVKSGVRSSFRVIRCRFIFPGKNDELTPDFFDELTPDFFGIDKFLGLLSNHGGFDRDPGTQSSSRFSVVRGICNSLALRCPTRHMRAVS
jgi:hypothetical protein